MIKLFASDLDGTLLNRFHAVDPIVYASVRRVVRSGAHFAIATGRFMRHPWEFGFAGAGASAVCSNGALVYGEDGSLLRHSEIDPALVEEVLRAFPQIYFDCTGLRHVYTAESREGRIASQTQGRLTQLRESLEEPGLLARAPRMLAKAPRLLVRTLRLRAMVYGNRDVWHYDVPIETILSHTIVKLNCRVSDEGLRRELNAYLAERADQLTNAPYDSAIFEITRSDVDKGEAVAWLARELGVEQDEVAVYGDGGNDVAMLARFAPYGHAYAMEGAIPSAREAASEVIGSNLSYAVSRHMAATLREQTGA